MKKILIPFLVFSAIVGCKKDSGSSSQLPADLKRVTKYSLIDYEKNVTANYSISYTDNQIIGEGVFTDVSGNVKETIKRVNTYQAGKLVEDTNYENAIPKERYLLTYDAEGNLSSKTLYVYKDKGDATKRTRVYTYTYAGGKVSEEEVSEKEPLSDEYKFKKIYKYSGNTIKVYEVSYDKTTGKYTDIDETSYTLYTYENNGNLLSEQSFRNNELSFSAETEYDNKISLNTVIGDANSTMPTGIPVAKNNVTKKTRTSYSGRRIISTDIQTYTYQYNNEGYPIERNYYYKGVQNSKITITY